VIKREAVILLQRAHNFDDYADSPNWEYEYDTDASNGENGKVAIRWNTTRAILKSSHVSALPIE